MTKVKNDEGCCENDHKHQKNRSICGGSSVVYCFGLIGAAVYFINQATTFWLGVLGFLKALVWPAIIVYKILNFLTS